MKTRGRLITLAAIAVTPFISRWTHETFRAPQGASEPYVNYLWLAALCVVVVATMEAPPRTSSVVRVLVRTTVVAGVVLGASATSQVFFPASLPRFVIVFNTLLVFVVLLLAGTANALLLRRQGGTHKVLAVIDPTEAAALVADVESGPVEQRFVLVEAGIPAADHAWLADRCRAQGVTTLVLGEAASTDPVVMEQASILHSEGVRVRRLDDFYDETIGKLPLSALDRFALMGDIESLHGAYAPLKRFIDIVLAMVGAMFAVLLLPVILIGNAIANRGPLFFRQQRVGLNGRPFGIWKFRTMAPGAADVSGWTSNDDPRITRFGKLLRRTHVDELPQVINIFVGDLAVVGPRPEQLEYARQLEQRLPFYAARHLVRPGLTGWAQVKYQYAASEEDAYVKLQYDLHYVRHESLATDLRIIWMTVHHVLVDGGR